MTAPTGNYQGVSGFTFTQEENEQLTRVGPGTLMGDLFRQYWIAVIPSSFLSESGVKPLRIRLLCEDLVLFRAGNGKIGLVGAYCQHRLAPLYLGASRITAFAAYTMVGSTPLTAPVWKCRIFPRINSFVMRFIIPVIFVSNTAESSGRIWVRPRNFPRCLNLNSL